MGVGAGGQGLREWQAKAGPRGWRAEAGPRHALVVASPCDGAVLVAALLHLVLERAAAGLGQQVQLRFCEHICGGWGRALSPEP